MTRDRYCELVTHSKSSNHSFVEVSSSQSNSERVAAIRPRLPTVGSMLSGERAHEESRSLHAHSPPPFHHALFCCSISAQVRPRAWNTVREGASREQSVKTERSLATWGQRTARGARHWPFKWHCPYSHPLQKMAAPRQGTQCMGTPFRFLWGREQPTFVIFLRRAPLPKKTPRAPSNVHPMSSILASSPS
jgi:hypothetical protein